MSTQQDKPVVKHLEDAAEQLAGDHCRLKELLHPHRHPVQISYSLAFAHVAPGGRTLDHRLDQSEVYYFLQGRGRLVLDDHPFPVGPGSCCYVPGGCRQFLVNEGQTRMEFLCIVAPPWREERETILEDP